MNDRRSVTTSDDQNPRLYSRQVYHVWPDEIALRVVFHTSAIPGLIGVNGSVISKLRDEADAKIHIQNPVTGSDYRNVFIVGSPTIDKIISLTDRVGGLTGEEQEEDSVTYDVSAPQVALIRVLERAWMFPGKDEPPFCWFLADQAQIRAVEMRRRETDAMIRVLPPPTSGTNKDVLIQITGDVLSVKKAVVMVSSCLQDCPPVDGYQPPLCSRAYDSSNDGNSEEPHFELFPNLRSLLPPISSAYNALEATSSRHDDSRDTVVFRLICTSKGAGGIIGKRRVVIEALQNQTGAAIEVNNPFKNDERLVTISAIENLESTYSPAQNALILAFARTVEMDIDRRLVSGLHDGTTVKARLLVPSQFVNGLNVKDKELIATGAELHVISVGEQIMDQISEHQSTIEIKGNFKQVQKAMSHITYKLRDNLLLEKLLDNVRARVSNEPYEVTQQETATRGYDDEQEELMMVKTGTNLVKSSDFLMQHTDDFEGGTARLASLQENEDLTQGLKQIQLSSNQEIISFPLRSKGMLLENITLELAMERRVLVRLYDRNGNGLDTLDKITGAKVDVRDRTRSEITVVISGTPHQTHAAMSWIVSIL